MLAAMNTAGSPAQTAAHLPQPPAFTNLINLLLGSPAPETANDTQDASATQTSAPQPEPMAANPPPSPAPAAQLVDAAQLADAMIRSMLSFAGNVASASASALTASAAGTPPKNTLVLAPQKADRPDATASAGAAVVAPVLAVLTQSPMLQSADTARASAPAKTGALKLPLGAAVVPAEAKSTKPAALAFGMKVTPVAELASAPGREPEPTLAQPAASSAAAPDPAPATPEFASAAEISTAAQEESTPATETDPARESAADPKASAAEPAESKLRPDVAAHAEAPVAAAAIASAPANTGDGANDFTRDFGRETAASVANVAAATSAGKSSLASPPTSAPASAMEALRSSETLGPSTSTLPATSVKEITVRMTAPQTPSVDVHLAERAGQLHVAVRTADEGLQTSLRQDLGTLVNSLERSGYRAEAFTSREAAQAPAASAPMNSQNGRQEAETGSGNRNGNFGDSSQNSGSGQQQQRRDPRQPTWIEELENQQ